MTSMSDFNSTEDPPEAPGEPRPRVSYPRVVLVIAVLLLCLWQVIPLLSGG